MSITNDMTTSGRTVTIHTSNPGESSNASNIGSYTFTQTAPSSDDIPLTLNPALRSNDIIYFRYYTSGWGRTYYIATATVRDLLNATADKPLSLTFKVVE